MKVHIATSRPIGMKCALWYSNSAPIWRGYTEKVKLADVVVSVLYDQLFTEEFIKSKKAVYNFHPGILPEYRGAGLYSWAIINGEKEFGITLHKIDAGIDTGEIIDIRKFPISEDDTAETLKEKGDKVLFAMFKHWIHDIVRGKYESIPQGEGKTYYRKDLDNAKDLTKYVRAFSYQGKEPAYYYDSKNRKHELHYEETKQEQYKYSRRI